MSITETEDVELPSIYVNQDILARYSCPTILSSSGDDNSYKVNGSFVEDLSPDPFYTSVTNKKFCYKVNDQTFTEKPCTDDEFIEFAVVKRSNKMDCEYDTYCSTPTSESEIEEDHTTELEVTLKFTSNGYVINGTCFLSWQQWHTIIATNVSDDLAQCCVCAIYCEVKSCEKHVNSDIHREALIRSPPLHVFDLSITRKIRNNYHCAVCNEQFPLNLENEHYSSKMHEGNLLFAINKASDLLDGPNHKKKETFHFQTRNNIVDNRLNDNYHRENDRYSSETEHYRRLNDNFNDNDYSNFNDNNNFINYQNCYDDYEDEAPSFTGVSYANIAKIPKANTQTFIEIDLGNKKVKVRFDSWHMVINHKVNRFWCMVCKVQDHLRKKVEHCNEAGHLENLEKCHVVEAYEEYFIRQVDDKLYHCGHCNNLQLIHEMEDHVECNHPRRTKLVTDTKNLKIASIKTPELSNTAESPTKNTGSPTTNTGSPTKNTESPTRNTESLATNTVHLAKNTVSPAKNTEKLPKTTGSPMKTTQTQSNNNYQDSFNNNNIKDVRNSDITNNNSSSNVNSLSTLSPKTNGATAKKSPNERNSVTNTDITHKMPSILDNMVIYPFGFKITVPSLAYNIVCKRPNDYYCGLCDIVVSENAITGHIYDIHHIELLQRTPFILPFNCNLIRAIRDALHCAICNIPITADKIYEHIQDPQHTTYLTNALGHTQRNSPSMGVNIPNNPSNMPARVNLPNVATNILTNRVTTPVITMPPPVAVNTTKSHPVVVNTTKPLPVVVNTTKPLPVVANTTKPLPVVVNSTKPLPIGTVPDVSKTSFRVPTPVIHSPKHTNVAQEKNVEENEMDQDVEEESIEEFSDEDDLNETFDSQDDPTFDMEEFVYIKLKNTYIKITNTSYNTLVDVGDGSRYCFVCTVQVQYVELQKHADSRSHLENMEKYRFLDKYEDHLLRQIYLNYHCSICNVILTRKELKNHLEWPTHALQNDNTLKNIKKTRKNEIKGGIKQISVYTQQENIYLEGKEPKLKICFSVKLTNTKEAKSKKKSETLDITKPTDELRKHKIIIFKDTVLKISWDSWNGISKVKNGLKCILCQRDLKNDDIDVHCNSDWHKYGLDKPFEKQYAPALIRKINESTLNCLICNTEVSHKGHLTMEHIGGKKHLKNYETILKESSMANTYSDCNNDVLML